MAKQQPRSNRDAAGIGPYARERERLVPMSSMKGWDVIDGEADIRSWEVKTLSGKLLGTVRELLLDPKAGEVVMLDVDLADAGRAYVPIRAVEIDRARRIVRADSGDLEEHGADSTRLTPGDLAKVRKDVRYGKPSAAADRAVSHRPVADERGARPRLDDGRDEPESRL